MELSSDQVWRIGVDPEFREFESQSNSVSGGRVPGMESLQIMRVRSIRFLVMPLMGKVTPKCLKTCRHFIS